VHSAHFRKLPDDIDAASTSCDMKIMCGNKQQLWGTILVLLFFSGFHSGASAQTSVTYIFDSKWGRNGGDGSPGTGDGEFDTPMGVELDNLGYVYVADTANRRVKVFTSTGTFVTKWGTYGTGNGEFRNPRGITVDSSAVVYVADTENYRFQQFSSGGTFLSATASFWAMDIAVDTSGNIYVPDAGNISGYIRKYDASHNLVKEWSSGSVIEGIAVSPSGNLYVTCRNTNMVVEYSDNGSWIGGWGEYGSGEAQFSDPRGISVDSSGNVYIADSGNGRIQKFDPSGAFLTQWGSAGSADG